MQEEFDRFTAMWWQPKQHQLNPIKRELIKLFVNPVYFNDSVVVLAILMTFLYMDSQKHLRIRQNYAIFFQKYNIEIEMLTKKQLFLKNVPKIEKCRWTLKIASPTYIPESESLMFHCRRILPAVRASGRVERDAG